VWSVYALSLLLTYSVSQRLLYQVILSTYCNTSVGLSSNYKHWIAGADLGRGRAGSPPPLRWHGSRFRQCSLYVHAEPVSLLILWITSIFRIYHWFLLSVLFVGDQSVLLCPVSIVEQFIASVRL